MSKLDITTGHVYDNSIVEKALVSIIPENCDLKVSGSSFLTKNNPFAYDGNEIAFAKDVCIDFYDGSNWKQFVNRKAFTFDPASILDIGDELEYGTDYYIYLCFDETRPSLIVSKNSTYPYAYSELTSRKIGGFHYGAVRKVSNDGLYIPVDSIGLKFGDNGIKWQDNVTVGVIPNSIWDLKHRPKTLHPGLVEVNGVWIGIYQASVQELFTFENSANGNLIKNGRLTTRYGAMPATGTEGLNQYNFNEAASKIGMRLPRYTEWLSGAFGSPQGTASGSNYGRTATSNTGRTYTGCNVDTANGKYSPSTGIKPYAVSAYNLCDCAGNVWEWGSDYTIRQDSTSWQFYNVLGSNVGQGYLPNASGLAALVFGGDWLDGVACGSRTVHANSYPWGVHPNVGARLACDAA